jgi:hypothetical protein
MQMKARLQPASPPMLAVQAMPPQMQKQPHQIQKQQVLATQLQDLMVQHMPRQKQLTFPQQLFLWRERLQLFLKLRKRLEQLQVLAAPPLQMVVPVVAPHLTMKTTVSDLWR